jgi:hypothetical protein
MTAQQRKDEENETPKSPATEDKSKAAAQSDPKKPAGINYVFKFSPADPKNSLDFEDVADK